MDKEGEMMIFLLLMAAISSPVSGEEWKANIVQNLDALVGSCVVVPCSFTRPKEHKNSMCNGIWHLPNEPKQHIYSEIEDDILENFRGRTNLLGKLNQNNCTLEITEIKEHDTGPFCFRIEVTPKTGGFNFTDDCVELKTLPDPPEPILTDSKTATEDHPLSVTCSVTYTCTSHPPTLTWSKGKKDDIAEVHKDIKPGTWEVLSILTFTPTAQDDHSKLTCTATFYGEERRSSKTMMLYVKRKENYNHIIIPTVVGLGTALFFGFFCIFMVKKYKRRIAELQSRDGSMWNRLSRLSRRIRSGGPGPSPSDHRRPARDIGDLANNVNSNSCAGQKVSKPRFPSPKSQPKFCSYKEDLDDGDDYINTADLNVYGNV
ncbi:myeloid cell surface antigen CD33-like isoform X2 [Acanthopagrus latus]|uniref:myeloid cell surface antigen CD33-like isoform X1 n=2 Tax=Acanthopagrus latus TaxID=8177 RepID=UPI00187C35B1|nr:myeloid cell surface antigen CD33-like isoform X1 [Acanthopagrus latus]XP_036929735.1 myeloid cell surface antigen CD33-like isoform X1 [Acanthopagrus latus]XP_036929736.1 myeloid cell surface antigen CD33-like isoform X1 [Acanthopagrus latus]XP_036929737.1 myeloid cell surface antigen CD33-like isoform X1 [Acanthopagrus latus]XP_036929738.1 myeloid cell surface antigen CD33-like isoform X1 [Acanthopagrus latus]XP_036929739.1 myeloid cell surface antigen CD33-like isoform X1 [Acanthopagrus 